jgi:hypothetical protein
MECSYQTRCGRTRAHVEQAIRTLNHHSAKLGVSSTYRLLLFWFCHWSTDLVAGRCPVGLQAFVFTPAYTLCVQATPLSFHSFLLLSNNQTARRTSQHGHEDARPDSKSHFVQCYLCVDQRNNDRADTFGRCRRSAPPEVQHIYQSMM